MLRKISKKMWIAIAAILIVIVAIVLFIVLRKKEESYRLIKVYDLVGAATVKRGQTNILDAYVNMRLQSMDIVNTSADSYMQLVLDDNKYILLEPLTEIHLEATGTSKDSKTKIYLKKGAIVKCIEDRLSDSSEYKIETPNSTIAVRGTTFRVELVYDEKGESHTLLSVFEGKVDCNLIYPDGSVDEEFVSATDEQQIEILGTDVTSMYVVKDEPIVYEEYKDEVLEFLKVAIDHGKDLPVTKEEIDEIINGRKNDIDKPVELPTEEPTEDATEESTEETTEEPTEEFTEEPTEKVTEDSTEKPTRKPEEMENEEPTEKATYDDNSDETTTSQPDNSDSGPYTITFMYNGKIFTTQEVEHGAKVIRPTLKPARTGNWNYDFDTIVTGPLTIVYVEE